MLDAALVGLAHVVAWPSIGYLFLGVLVGIYFGAVPGLSGLTGMAILLPFTYGMDPVPAFAMLMAMYAVTTTSDTITAVLIGVPGTAAAAATILDGYPMAKKGQAARALGASFTCSAIGGVLGAVVLGLSLPVVRPLILSFASPEFFMLGVLGLTMVGTLSGGSMAKGLAAACLGILLSTVGFSPQSGIPRFTFDITYLMDDGLPMIPVALGLFAVPEVVLLALSQSSISQVEANKVEGGMWEGVKDAFRHRWLLLRASAIGMWIGVLPGVGGAVVDWVAYGHAVQSAKDKSQFGKGDIRGVIAPEAANNSMKGAALIPTVAFGIPGTATMAVMLGAFMIQGITPGPSMLTDKAYITFSMMWAVAIANVVAAAMLMVWSRQIAKFTFVRSALIVPAIVVFMFMGTWMSGTSMEDWILFLAMGLLGLVMRYAGWPRAPLILGFVLGSIMENALDITLQRYSWDWALRIPSGILMALSIATVVYSAIGYFKRRRSSEKVAGEGAAASEEEAAQQKFASLPLAVVGLAAFVYAIVQASVWTPEAGRMVLAFSYPGAALCLLLIVSEMRAFMAARGGLASLAAQYGAALRGAEEPRGVLTMYGWFGGIVLATFVAGQLVALPLFAFAYLKAKRESWILAAIYALGVGLFLWAVFDRLVHAVWQTPVWQ